MDNPSIYITSIREGKDYLLGEWVKLPVPPEKLDEVLERIGTEYEEYLVTDYESAFTNLDISQYSSIAELNDFAARLEELAEWDNDKLCAVLEMESPTGIAGILDIIEHLDEFDLLTEVEDDQALGEYFAEELCTLEAVPTHLRSYFDYEAYGRDIRLESVGCFTSYGYVMDNRLYSYPKS